MPAKTNYTGRGSLVQRCHEWGVLFAAIAFFLFPMTFSCLAGRNLFPIGEHLQMLNPFANFLPTKLPSWQIYHVQGRLMGRPNWQDIDLAKFSPVCVDGYLHRIDAILQALGTNQESILYQDLASWISFRWRDIYPDHIALADVRFVVFTWLPKDLNSSHLWARPWGRFPLDSGPVSKVRILATYRVAVPEGHKAILVPSQSSEALFKAKSDKIAFPSMSHLSKGASFSAPKFAPAPYKRRIQALDATQSPSRLLDQKIPSVHMNKEKTTVP